MNREKLSDHFDQKMLDFNFKVLAFIAAILLKPLATASDPFFRKNMGERYFTITSAIFGFFIWWGAGKMRSWLHANVYDLQPTSALQETIGAKLIPIIIGSFLGLAIRNLSAARKRQEEGIEWHSMSRGESLFGREDFLRDLIIGAFIAATLFYFVPLLGLVFSVSRVLSHLLADRAWRSFYNRYLDMRDAKIEHEHAETALRDRTAPKVNKGFYAPLPKRFKGEHRGHIARESLPVRVVAGFQQQANSTIVEPQKSKSETSILGRPADSELSDVDWGLALRRLMLGALRATASGLQWANRASSVLTKLFRRFAKSILIVSAVAVVGYGVFWGIKRLLRSEIKPRTSGVESKPRPRASPTVSSMSSTPESQPPTVRTSVVQLPYTSTPPIPPTGSEPSPIAPIGEPTQAQPTPERVAEFIQTHIVEQRIQIAAFQQEFEKAAAPKWGILSRVSRSIGGRSKAFRTSRDHMTETVTEEGITVTKWEDLIPTLGSLPPNTLQANMDLVTTNVQAMVKQRREVLAEVRALTSSKK